MEAYILHKDFHFRDAFKAYFPKNKFVGGLSVHYNTSPTATSLASNQSSLRIDDIIDGIGKKTTMLVVLKMIYTVAWNKIMYDIKPDASVTLAYPKNNSGKVLHQSLEETKYGVTLKGDAVTEGRFTLDKTFAQIMDIMNAGGTGLGSNVRYVFRGNKNMKRVDTITWNGTQVNL